MRLSYIVILQPNRSLDAQHRRRRLFAYLIRRGVEKYLSRRVEPQPAAKELATSLTTCLTPKEPEEVASEAGFAHTSVSM
jgi:hypothetical protein